MGACTNVYTMTIAVAQDQLACSSYCCVSRMCRHVRARLLQQYSVSFVMCERRRPFHSHPDVSAGAAATPRECGRIIAADAPLLLFTILRASSDGREGGGAATASAAWLSISCP
jgi:hypothetical protein